MRKKGKSLVFSCPPPLLDFFGTLHFRCAWENTWEKSQRGKKTFCTYAVVSVTLVARSSLWRTQPGRKMDDTRVDLGVPLDRANASDAVGGFVAHAEDHERDDFNDLHARDDDNDVEEPLGGGNDVRMDLERDRDDECNHPHHRNEVFLIVSSLSTDSTTLAKHR